MENSETKNREDEFLWKLFFVLFVSLVIIYLLSREGVDTLVYPICILFALLLTLIVSGKIEINIGNLIKIKKDIERVRKDVSDLKMFISSQKNYNTFNFGDGFKKYYDLNNAASDIEDTVENVFYDTNGTAENINNKNKI